MLAKVQRALPKLQTILQKVQQLIAFIQALLSGSSSTANASDNRPTRIDVFNDSELLRQSSKRLTLAPVIHDDIYEMFHKEIACIWTLDEIDLTQDMIDWNTKLSDGQKTFIKFTLAFFSQFDSLINENISSTFSLEIQIPESRAFYAFQTGMEAIHGDVYSKLIETYCNGDAEEKMLLLDGIKNYDSIRKKAEWADKYSNPNTYSFPERVVAFACIEGIFFYAAFCAIYYFRNLNLMPGLQLSNEFIARDEALHVEHACCVFSKMLHEHKYPRCNSEVYGGPVRDSHTFQWKSELMNSCISIIKEAVEVEKLFVRDALNVDLIGMNSNLMCQYVEFVANRLAVSLHLGNVYETKNPFDWMESISLEKKTNFFEKRVSNYSKANGLKSTSALGDDCFNSLE
jgi:ribonucleotide reductase beta subunit family protein with ferritin-like domain